MISLFISGEKVLKFVPRGKLFSEYTLSVTASLLESFSVHIRSLGLGHTTNEVTGPGQHNK